MTAVLLLIVVGLTLMSNLSTVQIDVELERATRLAFLDALVEARITHKEAYLLLGYSKGHWSDMCAGERPLPNHTRLLTLPWSFWSAYLPKLAYAVVQKNVGEIAQDLRMRRNG
jgi:hypothetical protein